MRERSIVHYPQRPGVARPNLDIVEDDEGPAERKVSVLDRASKLSRTYPLMAETVR